MEDEEKFKQNKNLSPDRKRSNDFRKQLSRLRKHETSKSNISSR